VARNGSLRGDFGGFELVGESGGHRVVAPVSLLAVLLEKERSRQDAGATNKMPWSKIRTRGRMPHWEESAGICFVTFRLADSLPQKALLRIEAEIREEEDSAGSKAKKLELYLDRGCGACFLARPEIADIVANTLRAFKGLRYRLFAWRVMLNHVHAVLQPREPFELASILHSWKSYSAQIANRALKRKGSFWQREYYDHLIRDGNELGRAISYTADNPLKAGLRDWKWVYVSKDWT
jgi:REP element-mobilizing transposase RayT